MQRKGLARFRLLEALVEIQEFDTIAKHWSARLGSLNRRALGGHHQEAEHDDGSIEP